MDMGITQNNNLKISWHRKMPYIVERQHRGKREHHSPP